MSSSKEHVIELLGPSESRRWTWVFRALWSSAPRDSSKTGQWKQGDTGDISISISSVSSPSRIAAPSCHLQLQIPDTVLFESGEPRKWVGTSREGIVVRKSFLRPVSSDNNTGNDSTVDFADQRAAVSPEIRHRPLATRRIICRQQRSSSRGILDELEILQRLDTVRMAFVAFVSRGSTSTERNTPVCVVRYSDGSAELLSENSLQKLGRIHHWRISLSGLQAYVRPAQAATGAYDRGSRKSNRENDRKRKPKDHVTFLSKIRQATHESDGTSEGSGRPTNSPAATSSSDRACHNSGGLTARFPSSSTPPDTGMTPMDYTQIATRQRLSASTLDVAARDVAWAVEMSYAWAKEPRSHLRGNNTTATQNGDTTIRNAGSLGGGSSSSSRSSRQVLLCGTRGGGLPSWPKSRVRISRLEAEFVIDDTGCTWFSHATRVMVQMVAKETKVQKSLERKGAKRKRLREEATVAASVAARELRALVTLACRRGLNPEEVFCHFDVQGCGQAGKEEVLKGMGALGISLSIDGAAILVEWIIAACSSSAQGQPSTTTPPSASQQGNLGNVLLDTDMRETTGGSSTGVNSNASRAAAKNPKQVVQQNNGAGLTSTPLLWRQKFTADELWKFARTTPAENSISSKAAVVRNPDGNDNNDDDDDDGKLTPGHGSAPIVEPHETRLSGDDEKRTMEKSMFTKQRRTSGDIASDRSGLGLAESHSSSNNTFTSTGKEGAILKEEKFSNTKRRRWRKQQRQQGSRSTLLHPDDRFDLITSKTQEIERQPSSSAQTPSSVTVSANDDFSQRHTSGLTENEAVRHPSHSTLCSGMTDHNVLSAAGRGSELHRGEPGELQNIGVSERVKSAQGAKGVRSADCDDTGVLASFPCDNPLEEASFGKDRVYHVERGLVIAYRVLRRTSSPAEGDQRLPTSVFDSRSRTAAVSPLVNAATTSDDQNTVDIERTSPKDDTKSREASELNFSDTYGKSPKVFSSVRINGGHEGVNSGVAAGCTSEISASLREHFTDDAVTDGCNRGTVEGASAGSSGNMYSVSPNTCDDKSPSQGGSTVSSTVLLVAVPGLFQTLDTLETALTPLIEARYPCANVTVLLVAPPGLPNTHWPTTVTLDGKLTSFCVASLLEHLLEGEELIPKGSQSPMNTRQQLSPSDHSSSASIKTPTTGDSVCVEEPNTLPSAESVLEVATAAAEIPSEDGERSATDATGKCHVERGNDKIRPVPTPDTAKASLPRKNEMVDNVSASSSPSAVPPAVPPTETTACSDVGAAVVFVGFGSGAHALLHLVDGPLLPQSPECSAYTDTNSSGGRCIHDNTSTQDFSRGSGSERLALSLNRRGLRISGLVLVNGFISLDEQSEQVVRTLRQAFYDQSDGYTRAEAVTSLLLSEHHHRLQDKSAAGGAVVAAKNVTQNYLKTREKLRLDADVSATSSAAYYLHQQQYGRPARVSTAPVGWGTSSSVSGVDRSSRNFFVSGTEEAEGIGVESVLSEMEHVNRKRLRRFQRIYRHKQHRYSRDRGNTTNKLRFLDDEDDRRYDKGDQTTEGEDDELHSSTNVEGNASNHRPQGGSAGYFTRRGKGERAGDLTSRLALAASASVLDSLLVRGAKDKGVIYDDSACDSKSFMGDVAAVESAAAAACVDGVACSESATTTFMSEDEGGGDVGGLLRAVRRLDVPLVMVQSTEDALVGTPLPLVLQKELPTEDLIAAKAGSVFECLNPLRAAGEGHLASAASSGDDFSPIGVGKCAKDEERRRGGSGNRLPHDGAGAVAKEGTFRVHAAWVKAGHDVLHERESFLLSLLNKVIYACHGQEPPPQSALTTLSASLESTGDVKETTGNAHGIPTEYTRVSSGETTDKMMNNIAPDADSTTETINCEEKTGSREGIERGRCAMVKGGGIEISHDGGFRPSSVTAGDDSDDATATPLGPRGKGCARGGTDSASIATATTGTGSTYESLSVAFETVGRQAPKLIDFYDFNDAESCREFRRARDYIEDFRVFSLDRAVLEGDLGGSRDRIAALNVPEVARYAFQTMKECWSLRTLAVEATRLNLDMSKRQRRAREELAQSIRAVNAMTRTLRKSGPSGDRDSAVDEKSLLYLEAEDQRALRAEIAVAEVERMTQYVACRKLRRRGTVFRARCARLDHALEDTTGAAKRAVDALERVMGQLRKQLALARIQERVFTEELEKVEQNGLHARRRLAVVEEQLALLERHPYKWADSDAWQPGYVQRVETSELVKLLSDERRQQRSMAQDSEQQGAHARGLRSAVSNQGVELASTMEGVGAIFSLLKDALEDDESFTKDLATTASELKTAENEILGVVDDVARGGAGGASNAPEQKRSRGGRRGLRLPPSVAARVRSTHHRNRTSDEKRWIALDVVANPSMYHHVTQTEAEEMRWDALYYTRLDREDITRVLSLPQQVQLALPFLHTPDEVAAHELLARYTLGASPDHFARLDRHSQDICIIEKPSPPSLLRSTTRVATPGSEEGIVSRYLSTTPAETEGSVGAGHEEIHAVGEEGEDENSSITGAAATPPRVLACIRRGAEAQIKIAAEWDRDEAIWIALDAKLRPDFYHEDDEAEGDRQEELHQEADAREDSRYAWLKTDPTNASGAIESLLGDGVNIDNIRGLDTPVHSIHGHPATQDKTVTAEAGGDSRVGSTMVYSKREALAKRVAEAFNVNELKLLAADLRRGGGGSLVTGVEAASTARPQGSGDPTNTTINNEYGNLGEKTSGGLPTGENMASGDNQMASLGNSSCSPSSTWSRHHGEGDNADVVGGDIFTGTNREREAAPPGIELTRSQDKKQVAADGSRRTEEVPENAMLVATAKRVLSLYLVREEETPLGRDMTRALAMLQEVALRLSSGQARGIFRGLNQHTAFVALSSPPQRPCPFPSEESTGIATAHGLGKPVVGGGGNIVPKAGDIAGTVSEASATPVVSIAATSRYPDASLEFGDRRQDSGPCGVPDSACTCGGGCSGGGCQSSGQGIPVDDKQGEDTIVERRRPRKVFGSWEEIHPASLGTGSQEVQFWAREGNEDTGEKLHPASFRASANTGSLDDWSFFSSGTADTVATIQDASSLKNTIVTGNTHQRRGNCFELNDPLDILTGEGHTGAAEWLTWGDGNGESNMVASGMDRVGELDPVEVQRRGLLVASRQRTCLLEVETCELDAGQSKSHAFDVGPYATSSSSTRKDSSAEEECGAAAKVVLGIAVTVVFQGNFEKDGYRLGRLAAGLYRMPPPQEQGLGQTAVEVDRELPQPVGFAPHSLQSLNTHEAMGRVMIFHQPRVQPVREGRFQLVIGAASRVRYSATVTAVTAADAHVVFDEKRLEATRQQERLPSLLVEMEALKDVSKLSRWKQRVVRELLEEAREEAVRCESELNEVKREIQADENDQKLDDNGRRALLAEARDLGAEAARWKVVFASRSQEGKDVRSGLEDIKEKLKALDKETSDVQAHLAQARKRLPAAAFVLKNEHEATDIALVLNATVDPFSGASARWAAVGLLKERSEIALSPAERVRRALKDEGWNTLTLDEKRFTMLDRVLHPDLYLWMKEGTTDEEGSVIAVGDGPSSPKMRRDSLTALIGAGPLASTALDSAQNVEEAMQTKKTQGWSKKARNFATPGAWRGGGKTSDADAGAKSTGSVTVSPDTNGSEEKPRNKTARSEVATGNPTLADEWSLPDFSFSKMELERVMKSSVHRLQRGELRARKLLRTFHDERVAEGSAKASADKLAVALEHRCASIRAKDAAARTPEEHDWVKIDKILFPEVWRANQRQEERLRQFNRTLAIFPHTREFVAAPDEFSNSSDAHDDNEGSNDGSNDSANSTIGHHAGEDNVDDVSGKRTSSSSGGGKRGGGRSRQRRENNQWECPFDAEEILQMWASDDPPPSTPRATANGDSCRSVERLLADRAADVARVRSLLLKFNGPLSTLFRSEAQRGKTRKNQGQDPLTFTVTTSKRIASYAADHYRPDSAQDQENARKRGPDAQIIALLRQLIAAKTIRSKYMDTDAVHGTAQRFSTERYAANLEREIASQLREQILERERVMDHESKENSHDHEDVSDSSDDEAENWEVKTPMDTLMTDKATRQVARTSDQTRTSLGPSLNNKTTTADSTSTGNSAGGIVAPSTSPASKFSHKSGSTTTATGTATEDRSGDPYGGIDSGRPEQEQTKWHDLPVVQEFTEEEVSEIIYETPGWEGCLSCLTLPCRWCSCADHWSIHARKQQLRDELFRLMRLWDEDEVCTLVPLSCVRGGVTSLSRTDAIHELRWEATELDRQLHLADVDKELHDAYNCRQEAIEVRSLHSYSTLMWCKDAQVALAKERDHVLARTMAGEVVDDLLESMLDGWVFGERQAEHAAGGFVPAVKASGPLRPGDQRRAVAYLEHRHRLRSIAHAKGERLPEEIKGTHHSKAKKIDTVAQQRILIDRAHKKEEDQRHLLKEIETTMKFGIFSMVQGYLHAMRLVQREKGAWSGREDVIGRDNSTNAHRRAPLTLERKKMIQQDTKARERATARRQFMQRARAAEERGDLRDAKNKRRISQRKAMRVLEIRAKDNAARNIQRVFRGYRGKVFAQRWALKRAEIDALKSVLHEAAINVQRAYRGHLGRVEASEVRMELAEYIADVRVKEAESDLAEFWETHKFKTTKDNFKKKMATTIGVPLLALRRKKLE